MSLLGHKSYSHSETNTYKITHLNHVDSPPFRMYFMKECLRTFTTRALPYALPSSPHHYRNATSVQLSMKEDAGKGGLHRQADHSSAEVL